MFYVTCPHCEAHVEIPSEAVGPSRTDPWNVAHCYECGNTFDFDNDEVMEEPDTR